MATRQSLKSFLAAARTALTRPSSQRTAPLTFVVGNESADLDSLCSAVVFAYLRSHATTPQTLHIPLSNLPREDLALRTEMTAVLGRAGLKLSDLLTLSELPEQLEPADTRWYLVDHNCFTGPLKKFGGQIAGCVDHHVDEGVIPQSVSPRVIEPCGSCVSLIVDEARSVWDGLPKQMDDSSSASEEDEKLAMLAIAPIIIDTTNFTSKDKVKPNDTSSLAYLKGKVHSKDFNADSYYSEVTKVKEDIGNLSFRDIFRKDYKEWEDGGLTLGISCAVQNLDFLVAKENSTQKMMDDFTAWAEERKLDFASIMTTAHPNGEFQRDLLVWGMTDGGKEAVDRFLKNEDKLKLETWQGGKVDDAGAKKFAWRQRELTASRKQVAPLLREALKKD